MEQSLSILAFAGSLRKESYNKVLLHNAQELAPKNLTITFFDLEGSPLYNANLETFRDWILRFQ